MIKGINKANPFKQKSFQEILEEIGSSKTASSKRKCVFISHKKEDTAACEPIAEYLTSAGIDVFFDKWTPSLSQLADAGKHDELTHTIQKGIDESSHMLCVVSPKTINPFWVPFEVGYGYCKLQLGVLTLKGMNDEQLPDYMKTTRVIRGTKSLNTFISTLLARKASLLESRHVIKSASLNSHPLDGVLDWDR